MTKISMHIYKNVCKKEQDNQEYRVNHPQVHVEQFGLSPMCLECDLNQEQWGIQL